VKAAELVVIAAPVDRIVPLVRTIAPALRKAPSSATLAV